MVEPEFTALLMPLCQPLEAQPRALPKESLHFVQSHLQANFFRVDSLNTWDFLSPLTLLPFPKALGVPLLQIPILSVPSHLLQLSGL